MTISDQFTLNSRPTVKSLVQANRSFLRTVCTFISHHFYVSPFKETPPSQIELQVYSPNIDIYTHNNNFLPLSIKDHKLFVNVFLFPVPSTYIVTFSKWNMLHWWLPGKQIMKTIPVGLFFPSLVVNPFFIVRYTVKMTNKLRCLI